MLIDGLVIKMNLCRNMSEARSYDETTVQPPTKAIRNIYFKQSSHTNNDVSFGIQFYQS